MIVMIGKNTDESMRNVRIIGLLSTLTLSIPLFPHLSHTLLFSLLSYSISRTIPYNFDFQPKEW